MSATVVTENHELRTCFVVQLAKDGNFSAFGNFDAFGDAEASEEASSVGSSNSCGDHNAADASIKDGVQKGTHPGSFLGYDAVDDSSD